MTTIDRIIILWCCISSGFALACGAGWLASCVAIGAGHGDSTAVGVVVLIVAAACGFVGACGVGRVMGWVYEE